MLSDLGGGHHGHLVLTMNVGDYLEQIVHMFVPPYNPGNYPLTIGTAQEKLIGNKRFEQNQALFRRYTAIDGAIKNKNVTAVQPVLLYPLPYQSTGFGQVMAVQMIQYLLISYGVIDKINLKENSIKMMGSYDPTEPPACLIDQIKGGGDGGCKIWRVDD